MNEHIDIEVKRMSKESIEMLNNLSAVCKRYGINYYRATQEMRDLLDTIALHEYQLQKAREQGLTRSSVPPFMGIKRSERSNKTELVFTQGSVQICTGSFLLR